MSLCALIVNYWCRTLYCPKQAQMILLQYLSVTLFSLLFIFFASPANVCHIDDIKRGAADRKPWSSLLKLSSFFGRHNYDQGNGYAKSRRWSRQRQNLYDRVPSSPTCDCNLKPDKGAGLATCRREQSCRGEFCAFR